MNDAKKLLADMKALGIKEGETILVHASMKALGTKETPETVLDTLQAALGDDGTLLLPALTYENVTPVELTALHGEDITPVGKNSPFMKLPEIGGRLLFIGEVLDCCTFMHGVEERFGTDYVLTKEKIRYVVNGEEKYMYGHDFKGWETTYRRVKEILDPAKNEIVTGKIGDATCYLIDAKALLKRAEEKLRENQHWFVVPRE